MAAAPDSCRGLPIKVFTTALNLWGLAHPDVTDIVHVNWLEVRQLADTIMGKTPKKILPKAKKVTP